MADVAFKTALNQLKRKENQKSHINFFLFYQSFVTKRPKLAAQMVRPVDGLRASSIVWGQIRRPDSTDPDDGHM